ncbi:putative AfsR family transcriptional regulator [Streptomyces bingchenggensis BCW-1]|uniref:Putative AfsR family transcriptional regulator n=1 Tax=Streptomyces bingchenggensis (strain BCW-1) TaxID=749414 RepID=D7C3S6_STRBB|nr:MULTISPECIES: BTAD domain-containing putative transcriptional regulator [Streptomyces]ADI12292.1 putative AfsR family transcriptional regulator [Streptomyces bingchenggensis BCW-1]
MSRESVRFAVLGPIRAWRAGAELDLGRPQQRVLLGLLLARAGRPVGLSEIVDALWGEDPPGSAVNVVRRHIGILRRTLEPGLPLRAPGHWLLREAAGYRIAVDADSLDLLRFRQLREQADEAADRSPGRAVTLLTEALALWKGPAGADVSVEIRARALLDVLDREHLAAVKELADAALRAGMTAPVLDELRKATLANPLDEPLLARLVLALAATGQRAEALETHRAAVARLADELGLTPGRELSDAHAAVLRESGPAARPAAASAAASAAGSGAALGGEPADGGLLSAIPLPGVGYSEPRPAQLPQDLPIFSGRRAQLAKLSALLPEEGRPLDTAVISVIEGMAGVGKTTLAVHWAHQVADRFPDGQFYVDLRGFDPTGTALDPGEAVRDFLCALGVPRHRVPHGLDAQTALYRSLLAGRRFLVLLDNALDTQQVRPLLPGAPGCLVIVTSRDTLTGLVADHGAHPLSLCWFDAEEGRELLAARLGAARVAAEPQAAAEIVELCAGLPLALSCVAARLAAHPGFRLSALAAELRDAHDRLDAIARGSAEVSTVFSWSYRALSAGAARLFRLLAGHPGPDLSAPAVAELAGLGTQESARLLAELTRAHLVAELSPGRYSVHDLLRSYAAELGDDGH